MTEGIIKRDERFGYIELPDDITLDRAIDMIDFESDPQEDYAYRVGITIFKRFDLRNGHPVDRES